jgi:hypothetical protein
LTVACQIGNQYEQNQHERLSVRLGFGREWVQRVEQLSPDVSGLPADEAAIQRFVLAAIASMGRDSDTEFEAVVDAVGPEAAVAVLMVIGRYLVHGLFVNCLNLAPPVPSIFEDDFTG